MCCPAETTTIHMHIAAHCIFGPLEALVPEPSRVVPLPLPCVCVSQPNLAPFVRRVFEIIVFEQVLVKLAREPSNLALLTQDARLSVLMKLAKSTTLATRLKHGVFRVGVQGPCGGTLRCLLPCHPCHRGSCVGVHVVGLRTLSLNLCNRSTSTFDVSPFDFTVSLGCLDSICVSALLGCG